MLCDVATVKTYIYQIELLNKHEMLANKIPFGNLENDDMHHAIVSAVGYSLCFKSNQIKNVLLHIAKTCQLIC